MNHENPVGVGVDIMAKEHEKYIFVFSSNYHGYYIEDMLTRNEISTTLRKAPRTVGKSCQFAIYIYERDFSKAKEVIEKSRISPIGVYEIIKGDKVDTFQRVSTV